MKWLAAWLTLLPLVASAAANSPILPSRVEKAITERVAVGQYPAVVVAVVDGDRHRVYAFGKLGDDKAPDADTIFQIGSVTKTFTATLLAEAIGAQRVKPGTPVADLLPHFSIPARGSKRITLGELATQFSGLPRLPSNLDPANPADPYAGYDATKLKAFLAGYTLPRDPGSQYEYSNLGFGLLGFALAQHAGMSYAELVKLRVLKPLGMTASSASFALPLDPRWATGHDANGKPAQPWHLGVLAGAGAINSTGADMLRYLEANMGGNDGALERAMKLARQPRRSVGAGERIGLAWMTRHDKDGDIVWHNGMTGGYASFMGFTADGKRGVVVLANIARSVDELGFATLLADAPLTPASKQIAMSPDELDAYVGSYQLAPGFVLKVFRESDQLMAQATGQGAFAVYPSATDRFFARVAGIRIDFQRGKDGKVASLVLHQGGHDSPANRVADGDATAATAHHTIQLDVATLRQYIGHYQLAPGAVFDVTLKGTQLYAQLSGQPAFPVYASARDEFRYTVVDAQLSFKRGKDGKVDALVLHQNGMDQRAIRLP